MKLTATSVCNTFAFSHHHELQSTSRIVTLCAGCMCTALHHHYWRETLGLLCGLASVLFCMTASPLMSLPRINQNKHATWHICVASWTRLLWYMFPLFCFCCARSRQVFLLLCILMLFKRCRGPLLIGRHRSSRSCSWHRGALSA